MTEPCPTCGDELKSGFGVKLHHARTHGESLVKKTGRCDRCDDEFEYHPKMQPGIYCSNWCSTREQMNRVESTCDVCGHTFSRPESTDNHNESSVCSSECFKDMLSENWNGEKNPRWNEDYDGSWRESERWNKIRQEQKRYDDWTCQDCGERGVELHTHHIIPVSEGGDKFDDDNLTTLCVVCHGNRHKEDGYEHLINPQ